MSSKESTKSENAFWRAAAERSGSSQTYQVDRTAPLGVGKYVPTKSVPNAE